jgi:DNA-binding transcriptional MerR regulator
MIATEPQVSMTGRYSSKETSTLLDIHRNTLRNYTNNGDIKCGYRKTNGRRFFLGSEILRFWKAQL